MKIGLTYTGTEEKHANYINWLKAGTDHPVEVITLSAENDNLHQLEQCDALVLSGGIDIEPELYGKGKNYAHAPEHFNKKRDAFETALFNLAQQKNLPVLGVCRGMQLVNCILGGTMQQDLGSSKNKIHRSENLVDKAHGASVVPASLLHEVIKEDRVVVNSAHHQAVKRIGKKLQANCYADDGTVEGLEWKTKKNKPFLLCIQWHPERMYKFQLQDAPVSKMIRERFIEEIKKSLVL